ncbi:spermatogenesis-associated protein 22 [Bufo gargarizans]|uniref:spermatogenesis-associated protein 22 n=1 Tax=Bufo gargarizans TaxID=30331 RepID=UPI001CF10DF9|nr:spermatogenesis-associated protein 22 [Bufo gargarizans]
MKRSLPACLPVPVFNLKKRNRQPLTSVPQIKELPSDGTHLVHESFHFPSLQTDSIWESRISQLQNAGKKMEIRPTDKRANICPGDENMFNNFGKDLLSGPKRHYGQMESLKGKSVNEKYSPVPLSTSVPSYKSSHYSSATSSGTKEHPPSYSFKCNVKLNNDSAFADMPEEEMVQAIPLYQMTFKEKSNSLRIISASVESMKYWSQYSNSIPLLFEILATLDSAVTLGDHGSKLFLLRDGKNHIQCIFYEIDRDLPRLIRGRIHRAMGNYDQKRNMFRCVSVRPASVAEQQAFTEYVFTADREMEKCVPSLEDTK